MTNKAVFIDRDGTICRDVSYCSNPDDFELLPTVAQAIKRLNDLGYKVIVITNQSGIARGYLTEVILEQIHNKMKSEFGRIGAHIDAIYYCPHHPEDECDCRKPGIELFLKAAAAIDIDLRSSCMIGDMQSDIDAGKALGCKTALVKTGPRLPALSDRNTSKNNHHPDYIASNLIEAVDWFTNYKSISILIPALNEKDGIGTTIQSIPKYTLEKMGYEVEILIVDNGSSDGTDKIAESLDVDVVYESKRGYGNAYKAGFKAAQGNIIATLDADATYPVEDIPRLVKLLDDKNLDFITTNRFALMKKGTMSFQNKLGNAILAIAVKLLYNLNMRDPESGMWVFRKKILREMILECDAWPFSHELKLEAAHYLKCKWKEVPIHYRARLGVSKLDSWRVGFKDLIHIIRKRFVR